MADSNLLEGGPFDTLAALTPPSNANAGGSYSGTVNTPIAVTATVDQGTGANYSQQWTANLAGTFADDTALSTTFTPTTVSSGYILTFTATNDEGSDADTATLDSQAAAQAPVITQNPTPSSATVTEPTGTSTTTAATGATSSQWYKGNPGDTSSPVSGATGDTLTFASTTTADSGNYYNRYTNATGSTNTTTFALTVNAANTPPTSTTIPDQQAYETFLYSLNTSNYFTAGTNPITSYTSVGSALPTWATLNSSTGILSGTPNSLTDFTGLVIRASDGTLSADSNPFNLSVSVAPVGVGTVWAGLSQVDDIYAGTTPVEEVWAGQLQVWSRKPPGFWYQDTISGTPGQTTFTFDLTGAQITAGDVCILAYSFRDSGSTAANLGAVSPTFNHTYYSELTDVAGYVGGRQLVGNETSITVSGVSYTGGTFNNNTSAFCLVIMRGVNMPAVNLAAVGTGTSGMADPPQVSFASAGCMIFGLQNDHPSTAVLAPADYTMLSQIGGNDAQSRQPRTMVAWNPNIGIATTENPGQFIADMSSDWVALTIPGF